MLASLLRRSFQRAQWLVAGVLAVLCGFQIVIVMIASELERSNGFPQLTALIPEAVLRMSGATMFSSLVGVTSFGLIDPVIILIVVEVGIYVGSEPAWEVESGIVDLVLGRPVPRGLIVVRSIAFATAVLGGMAVVMVLASRVALEVFAPPGAIRPSAAVTGMLAMNLTVVAVWFAAVSLLAASVARRRSVVLGGVGLAAVALYLLHLTCELWSKAAPLRFFTPYHYYNSPAILRHATGTFLRDVAILMSTAALAVTAAWRLYIRRDL
jgi:beta-exotoxin I transport system permease protein